MSLVALLSHLHPRRILSALDTLDAAAPSYSLARPQALRRVLLVLACACVCLLLLHYAKYSRNLHLLLAQLASWQGHSPEYYLQALETSGWLELLGYAWWTLWHFVAFIVLPCAVIRIGMGERVIDQGWRWNQTHRHWRGYLLLLSPILLFVYLVSLGDDFVEHYPFYYYAGRSWFDLIAWEVLYISQFIFLEFFFRGFMLNSLRPALGANAIWIMCVPYMMIHLPKLWLEATGAIFFGLFLGILALQSRSIWGGVLVHAGVALSMDIAALARKGQIPTQWWPW